jgi:hypothetical protein
LVIVLPRPVTDGPFVELYFLVVSFVVFVVAFAVELVPVRDFVVELVPDEDFVVELVSDEDFVVELVPVGGFVVELVFDVEYEVFVADVEELDSPQTKWNLEYIAQGWQLELMHSPSPQPVSPPKAAWVAMENSVAQRSHFDKLARGMVQVTEDLSPAITQYPLPVVYGNWPGAGGLGGVPTPIQTCASLYE